MNEKVGITASRSISSTILRGIKANDPASWNDLYQQCRPKVETWLRVWRITAADADDLVSKVFTKVWQGIGRFQRDTQGSTFTGWLYAIARNETNTEFQSRRKRPSLRDHEVLDRLASASDTVPDEPPTEKGRNVSYVLSRIRGEFRGAHTFRCFERYHLEEHDTKEIAEDFEMTENAVREARRRVMNRLREECQALFGHGIGPFEQGK